MKRIPIEDVPVSGAHRVELTKEIISLPAAEALVIRCRDKREVENKQATVLGCFRKARSISKELGDYIVRTHIDGTTLYVFKVKQTNIGQ